MAYAALSSFVPRSIASSGSNVNLLDLSVFISTSIFWPRAWTIILAGKNFHLLLDYFFRGPSSFKSFTNDSATAENSFGSAAHTGAVLILLLLKPISSRMLLANFTAFSE